MRTDLALRNLLQSKSKTALSVGGITVAVTLMFMQLGFRGSVESTATVIYSKMDFDLMVRSPDYLHFVLPGRIARSVLYEIGGQEQVASVVPFHTALANWDNPHEDQSRGIVVMGLDPTAPTFKPTARRVLRDVHKLTHPSLVLIDQMSFSEYGPVDRKRFGPRDVGVTTTVLTKDVQIAGLFEMGAGLAANGALITSEQGFDRLVPANARTNVSMGLIKLKGDLSQKERGRIARRLQHRFQTTDGHFECEVLTRRQVMRRELDRWIGETPIGFVFTLGVAISMIVGAMIVYMVLSADVANRLNEYATLRAMGYTNFYLSVVVLRQAVYLAVISYAFALLVSVTLYSITSSAARIPIGMTIGRAAFVFLLSLFMSATSGILALRKLWQAEPAELF